ncbi:MATH domain and coiled-coil domain-containing protein [Drosera capensis]
MNHHHHHAPPPDPAVTSTTTTSSSSTATSDHRQSPLAAVTVLPSPLLHQTPSSSSSSSSDPVSITRRGDFSAVFRWTVPDFAKAKARSLWSRYFEVGGFDCRLLVYPRGDRQALPGYVSLYLQVVDPRTTNSSKWECFISYRLSIVNGEKEGKSVHRDSWHRFSSRKKSHGWCDFVAGGMVLESKAGFLFGGNESLLIMADILVLNESVGFVRESGEVHNGVGGVVGVVQGPGADVLSGKFTWKVHNFSLFREMIKTQKIMSPVFPAGECNLRISVYQSLVNGVEYLSMCLESKDVDKSNYLLPERSCWCLFRMSVLNQKPGLNHMHRDSYGRFASDNKSGDNTSLGWNDFMVMSDFIGPDAGFLLDDTVVFSTSFHGVKELGSFSKNGGLLGTRSGSNTRKSEGNSGKFTWRIENFTKLKDILKKRKITGLCIKSRRFQIGNRDCHLIIYPRGQSQPPCYLSVFLEVTDSKSNSADWTCFVNHRLSVVNQRTEERSVIKESQNRYSKSAKDWGWREFITLTSLFCQDSGFLVHDTVVFSAEVLILKETVALEDLPALDSEIGSAWKRRSFTWKVENFLAFKEIMESRKIFSVYESFDTICIYLESDQSVGSNSDKNFWVRYRMSLINQKNPAKTVSKECSICTKTWNSSVLQFMKVSDVLEAEAGFFVRDTVVFVCEIMDCCPWFDFNDLEMLASEDDHDVLTTEPDDLVQSEDNDGVTGDEDDLFRNLLSGAGFHLTYDDNASHPQVTLREKLLSDAGVIAGFLAGLRVYLDDPAKVKRLLLPTKISGTNDGRKASKTDESSPSLMNLLMGVKVLQPAIVDLLLDIMVECCQPSKVSNHEGSMNFESGEASKIDSNFPREGSGAGSLDLKLSLEGSGTASRLDLNFPPQGSRAESPLQSGKEHEAEDRMQLFGRLDYGVGKTAMDFAGQKACVNGDDVYSKAVPGQSNHPHETSNSGPLAVGDASLHSKVKCSKQSEELLGLIVNSLRALDGAVPQGCPETRRRPHSAKKIAVVLEKAPKNLEPDLVALVPRLVEPSEHPLAAATLLERLQTSGAEPSLRQPVFCALSQLECRSEVWEFVLFQALGLLTSSKDELLTTVNFILNTAVKCGHLPRAVRSIRGRLKDLGVKVSPCVLDFLSRTIHTCLDVADLFLKDIDSDEDTGMTHSSKPSGLLFFGENRPPSERLHELDEQSYHTNHFSDIHLLIEMLSIPSLVIEASQTFERAVSRGAILGSSMAMVLECRDQRARYKSGSTAENLQILTAGTGEETNDQLKVGQDDFTAVFALAETLTLSRNPHVRNFVKLLYVIMFRQYADASHREKVLKLLVHHVSSSVDNSQESDFALDVLVFLVSEEHEVIRPVLGMMRETAELANIDRTALWHEVCIRENEIIRVREEAKAEVSNVNKDKATIAQRLSESEAFANQLKLEMKAEMERLSHEKKEISDQKLEVEKQLDWIRSERVEEIAKHYAEKKILQDRLHEAEAHLAHQSRKRDELKRVIKEKDALAERLKQAEASRNKFDEELKRYATENLTKEQIRKSLEDEVRHLTETVGQTAGEKREKEEQVARYEAYINGMESKLQACQHYIQKLELSLQDEMIRHAPLYGAGLEALSMKELETLARIHEEDLRQLHALHQLKAGGATSGPHLTPHTLPHSHALFHNSSALMAVGMPSSISHNGVSSMHGNGHAKVTIRPWFNR